MSLFLHVFVMVVNTKIQALIASFSGRVPDQADVKKNKRQWIYDW
jgi:hypothetical protein